MAPHSRVPAADRAPQAAVPRGLGVRSAPPARGRAGPGRGRARGGGDGPAGRERPGAPAPWRTVGPLASGAALFDRLLCAQSHLFLTTTAGRRPRMVPFYREGPRAKLRKVPWVTSGCRPAVGFRSPPSSRPVCLAFRRVVCEIPTLRRCSFQ